MTEKKSESVAVGDFVKAKSVTRPDGAQHTVTGGSYFIDVPGKYLIDGKEVEAR